MDDRNNEIDELLSSFNRQKEARDRRESESLEPPKRKSEIIDFAKTEEPKPIIEAEPKANAFEEPKAEKIKKEKAPKPKKTAEEIEAQKAKQKETAKNILLAIKKLVTNKKFFIPLIAIVLVAVAIISSISIVNYNKTSYLRPYQKAYPSVQFPEGIMKKYCDDYGKNPALQGYMTIEDISLDETLDTMNTQVLADGATRFNYVVYLEDNKLESVYSTIDGFNNSTKTIIFTDLINEYTFEVVGAFYTNTKPKDDDGYIFPYDTTEVMTQKSMKEYVERVSTRLIYNTNDGGITRQDLLLTLSCPTDYKKDYQFVVICKRVDKVKADLVASEKEKSHLTQKEYDEKGIENPYRFSSKWYPEIIITDQNGKESTIQRSIDYYKK